MFLVIDDVSVRFKKFYGPFESQDQAKEWAIHSLPHNDYTLWLIEPLHAPSAPVQPKVLQYLGEQDCC